MVGVNRARRHQDGQDGQDRQDTHDTGQWVDAAPFRAQLRHLMVVGGLEAAEVATLAGLSPRLTDRLLAGDGGRVLRRISPDTAYRLIQLTGSSVRSLSAVAVPAGMARLQLQHLRRLGWELPAVAVRLQVTTADLARLTEGAETCSARLTVRLTTLARVELAAVDPGAAVRVVDAA